MKRIITSIENGVMIWSALRLTLVKFEGKCLNLV